MARLQVSLPSGIERDGGWIRTASMRPICGADEMFLLENGNELAATRTSGLLARCVERLGDEPCSIDHVRALSVGDREALLLELRRLTFGDRIDCVQRCPNPDCGETMELPLSTSELLGSPNPHPRAEYEVEVDGHMLRLRVPTGDAQERASRAAVTDERAGLNALLAACVVEVRDPTGRALEETPPPLVEAIAACLEKLDPQAETVLRADCVACGKPFEALLDAATFLFAELGLPFKSARGGIFRDVHTLASVYHWSEADILGMATDRRRHYLSLIDESVS